MQDAFEHCGRLVREADRDRFIAALFAPAAKRPALHAIHAFAIEIARVRDVVSAPLPGEIRLQWWRDALTAVGHGEVGAHPVAAALLDTIARYRLPLEPLLGMIEARRFDLYDEPIRSTDELETYAAQTVAAPMRLTVEILAAAQGVDLDALVRHAGIAEATTDLLRALPLHASRRQVYIPVQILQRHGAGVEELFAGRVTPALRAAVADLRGLARRHFSAAAALASKLGPEAMPALLPVALVPAWLDRMDRTDDPLRPPDIAPWRRQWMLWRAARRPLRG
jgi:phytoene synthase